MILINKKRLFKNIIKKLFGFRALSNFPKILAKKYTLIHKDVTIVEHANTLELKFGHFLASNIYKIDGFPIAKIYHYFFILKASFSNLKDILIIGGGGFGLSSYIYKNYPDTNLTTIEIDPELYGLAQRYFHAPKENQRFKVAHQSASKFFANTLINKFDYILIDVGWHRRSKKRFDGDPQSINKILKLSSKILSKNGVLMANFITNLNKKERVWLMPFIKNLRNNFSKVEIYLDFPNEPDKLQDCTIIATNNKKKIKFSTKNLYFPRGVAKRKNYLNNLIHHRITL